MSFHSKIVLITGASSGIGAATAIHFSKLGAKLALTGRNLVNLQNVADQCEKSCSLKPFVITGDLTNEDDTKKILDSTISHYNQLDVLVNNAGILENGSIESTSLDQYDRVMNANVRSIYHLTMLAVPHLVKTKAVDQFTRCVALELAPKGVRVNSVNPGVVVTKLLTRQGMSEEDYSTFLDKTKFTHALGRPGTVEEVAKAIAFLASNDASFTTGDSVLVDGGRHAMCPR
ncbi:glucose 1-dehydrogenase-like isoform X2 [Metopolophium dirhodum]|uniref:glucose 1-dehydrogenase-like isoform X2 n=1 Tax=Metopolophium dirhodum TaxID=44670 RepID=UPI00299016DA|nr:glucose 1-dehydrogenase-like isoform X2 [Metopolophium dirhodum]